MSVDFRCSRCRRLLRTPEGSAGRQTQCPECGEVLVVPDLTSRPLDQGDAGPVVNPYQSPTLAAAAAEPVPPGEIVPTRIELADALSRSWAIFQSQLGVVVLGVFITYALTTVFQWSVSALIQIAAFLTREMAVLITVQIIGSLLNMAFQLWITLGQSAYLLKASRGERPNISDLFSGTIWFKNGLIATILFMLMFLPAAVVCFGPAGILYAINQDEQTAMVALFSGLPFYLVVAIWLSLTFYYFYLALVDRNCRAMESLALSRQVTRGNRLTLFGLLLVLMVLNFAGLLACCVGMVFTLSYSMLCYSVTWLMMTGQPTADQFLAGPNVTAHR